MRIILQMTMVIEVMGILIINEKNENSGKNIRDGD